MLERGGVAYRFTWNLYDPKQEGFKPEEVPGDGSKDDSNETLNPRGIESVGGYSYPR